MHLRALFVFSLFALANAPGFAGSSSVPSLTGTGHPYDPCAIITTTTIADTTGGAAKVYTPQAPTKNECIWTAGNKRANPANRSQ